MSGTTRAKMLITGGAGFIGSHCVYHFSRNGYEITLVDDLSRKGTEHNLQWLKECVDFHFHQTDIRDFQSMQTVFKEGPFDVIIHLAAQVAVTTSVIDPRTDFTINAAGTLNILESLRLFSPKALLIYSSTNKVYGELAHLKLTEDQWRYQLTDSIGITELQALDFHSPYGCSKGSADQYVIDYARIYGLYTVCFRQSCIYGERQFGVEDQGWVAWFIIAASLGFPITLYGSGKQVRDLLHIEDLIHIYELTIANRNRLKGEVFNVGGGYDNSFSILEFIEFLRELKIDIRYTHGAMRPGDQNIFISNNQKAKEILDWQPRVCCRDGIKRLKDWVYNHQDLLKRINGL